ncbi:MAG: 1-(5-phosphoribosyl)-5-((5-phosphoribosylamino)methylideneamino)imidazole-4-carboxamide isomerase [Rhodospirillales bacterium]|jgi:phosphoribosylformimino-5-aminoimidazole carboxamide ribotide isomerase|nr:1-(5-phosphoribosyl)-5-((5-phosphoribosylamino)methylideneamino)imidazole-4-carboxamide isomerase [Rhodospirillales bacterium]MBT4041091.1 1-(5-phosphoribosyl)-5-((5-phosphoribosylamino)methylideneamino)imidazole-4-carboxamide isomerase [Rhodospirillales bacterium]MBT4625174.1 1-(5-phosphoribosyl)-5-((5-phosphoribosylamino)methylideneamino)imidazole-4-carboxamide isomerase [Rhodospirillales bacterium]MBT5351324.1 1-(5-phosphoribosyl)-5-((5-phosphoribosylamino)methylideneamino)imidazole-4-carb
MMIFPDIELMDGKCVGLTRGEFDNAKYYDIDPLDQAKAFAAAGAQWIHVVDLDGVKQGGRHNADIITSIIDAVDIPVQVAGGIRTLATIQWWIDHGATRVVLGTAAIMDRRLVMEACAQYPGKIAVSVDERGGAVMIDGWREAASVSAMDVARQLQDAGVSAIIYTDIDRSDDLPDSSFAKTTEMARQLSVPVISSGTVRSLDDLSTLKYLPNISGAIVGWALFEEIFTLDEAIALCL